MFFCKFLSLQISQCVTFINLKIYQTAMAKKEASESTASLGDEVEEVVSPDELFDGLESTKP